MLTQLRSKFWIFRGRQYVWKVLHSCSLCRLIKGQPYSGPQLPPLSAFRTTIDRPFEHTGVDFAGPFYVKCDQTMEKAYLVLYTCAVTRAVHLDLVQDLTADMFLRSFRRFAARRGLPAVVKSDNGKTFKAAARIIKAIVDESAVSKYLQSTRVCWTFNVEKAPWWGGFFERLIKSVKRCMKNFLRTSHETEEELLTLLLEVEATLNSRPLTYVSTEDVREPLTPSHLLCGFRVLSLPDRPSEKINDVSFGRRYAYLQRLLSQFWTRWQKDYLLELRNSHRPGTTGSGDAASVGDVVVVLRDGVQRGLWKLGVIESVIPSTDGAVRAVKVRTTTKAGRTTHLNRPVQRLYPVEQAVSIESDDQPSNEETGRDIEALR